MSLIKHYSIDDLIDMRVQEIKRLYTYFDKPKKETIERLKQEIKELESQKKDL